MTAGFIYKRLPVLLIVLSVSWAVPSEAGAVESGAQPLRCGKYRAKGWLECAPKNCELVVFARSQDELRIRLSGVPLLYRSYAGRGISAEFEILTKKSPHLQAYLTDSVPLLALPDQTLKDLQLIQAKDCR